MTQRKLGRKADQRKALLRDLTTDLIINEYIVTTEARAKEVRRTVEKMITLGKKGDLHARRQAAAFVRNEVALNDFDEEKEVFPTALQKLFNDIAKRYEGRNGGYTRVLKTEPRRGDAAPMAIIELV
ncbi:MAG: 50S ribosomal protein L17 [Streptococcaceae bacterium]|jgi:large subunit ribosomal protein L17|nr:50S ribosomal protein L17 [Streptococcaceae bacterium]